MWVKLEAWVGLGGMPFITYTGVFGNSHGMFFQNREQFL
jgi:hypothetical protein